MFEIYTFKIWIDGKVDKWKVCKAGPPFVHTSIYPKQKFEYQCIFIKVGVLEKWKGRRFARQVPPFVHTSIYPKQKFEYQCIFIKVGVLEKWKGGKFARQVPPFVQISIFSKKKKKN